MCSFSGIAAIEAEYDIIVHDQDKAGMDDSDEETEQTTLFLDDDEDEYIDVKEEMFEEDEVELSFEDEGNPEKRIPIVRKRHLEATDDGNEDLGNFDDEEDKEEGDDKFDLEELEQEGNFDDEEEQLMNENAEWEEM
jgi:hypothetical protein